MKKLLLFIVALLFSHPVSAATYYVDNTAATCSTYRIVERDCGSGGEQNYATLAEVNSVLEANDIAYIRGGAEGYQVYNVTAVSGSGEGIQPDNSGTSYEAMITYSTYNDEMVHLQGNANSSSSSGYGIFIDSKNYIKVTGSSVNKLKISQCRRNIRVKGSYVGGTYSRYNEFSYIWSTDSALTASVSGNYDYSSNTLAENQEYNWVHHNKFERNGYYQSYNAFNFGLDPTWTYGDVSLDRYGVIENNEFAYAGHSPVSLSGQYTIFRNNYIHNEPWTSEGTAYDYGFRDSQWYGYVDNNGNMIFEGNRYGHAGGAYGNDPENPPVNGLGTNGLDLASPNGIVRFNAFFNNGGKAIDLRAAQYATARWMRSNNNRIFNNTMYYNGYNYGADLSYAEVINFMYTTANDIHTSSPIYWQATQSNVVKNNLFYDNYSNNQGEVVYGYGERFGETLVDATNCPATATAGCNIISNNYNDDAGENTDPKFVNTTLTSYDSWTLPDLNLQSDSPVIDQGTYLTTVHADDTDTGVSLIVADAKYFQDGKFGSASGIDTAKWPPGVDVQADYICVGTTVAGADCVQISAVNYSTNTLTVPSFTRVEGEYVWLQKISDGTLVLSGAAPDIGAYEYEASCTNCGVTIN